MVFCFFFVCAGGGGALGQFLLTFLGASHIFHHKLSYKPTGLAYFLSVILNSFSFSPDLQVPNFEQMDTNANEPPPSFRVCCYC